MAFTEKDKWTVDLDAKKWLGDVELSYSIWNNKYRFTSDETFDMWLERISGGNKEYAQLVREHKALLGGRTLSNRGTGNKSSLSNCYSSAYAPDSVDGMLELAKNLALTYQAQGGQGLSMSKVRPKGAPIRNGEFQSDGIIPFMEIFNTVTASISQGGCIAKDELVLTESGYKKIENVKIGDKVWTKVGFIEVNHVFDKGIQDIYEVKTEKGYSIKTTIDHKFAIDGFSTQKLGDLSVGNFVNIITKPSRYTKFNHLAYFLGYLMGNGYINQTENSGNLCMHNDQQEIKEKLIECIHELGFSTKESEDKNANATRLSLNKEIIDFLKSNNLLKNKTDKIEIPDIIMYGDDNTKFSYLAGAIDSDGSVVRNVVKYCTISEKYAQQLQKLMISIGFFPTCKSSKRECPRKDLYTVCEVIKEWTPKIPSIKLSLAKDLKPATSAIQRTPYTIKNAHIDKNMTPRLKKIGTNEPIGLATFLKSHSSYTPMLLDKIVSIELVGQDHVYDLSLVKEHLFSCNGIYVSNSRKGALMISLSAFHPEILSFITIKSDINKINKANLSVEIDDEFMEAVKTYYQTGEKVVVHRKETYDSGDFEYDITPIDVYLEICKQAHENAEPGIIYTNRFRNYNIMEKDPDYQIVTSNPCFTGDTLVLTDKGYCEIQSLVGKKVNVWNGYEYSEVEPRVTGENQELMKITFSNGISVKCTPYHKFILANSERVEAKDLKCGMKLEDFSYPVLGEIEEIENNFKSFKNIIEDSGSIEDGNLVIKCTDAKELQLAITALNIKSNVMDDYLVVPENELAKLNKYWHVTDKVYDKDIKFDIYIDKVEKLDYKADKVYCFTEYKNHSGIFNGILAAQCGKVLASL